MITPEGDKCSGAQFEGSEFSTSGPTEMIIHRPLHQGTSISRRPRHSDGSHRRRPARAAKQVCTGDDITFLMRYHHCMGQISDNFHFPVFIPASSRAAWNNHLPDHLSDFRPETSDLPWAMSPPSDSTTGEAVLASMFRCLCS